MTYGVYLIKLNVGFLIFDRCTKVNILTLGESGLEVYRNYYFQNFTVNL